MGVKKIMLLNYYFFNLRHSALLVLTVNDNEMTLDQIRSAKVATCVDRSTTHRLLLRRDRPPRLTAVASHKVVDKVGI